MVCGRLPEFCTAMECIMQENCFFVCIATGKLVFVITFHLEENWSRLCLISCLFRAALSQYRGVLCNPHEGRGALTYPCCKSVP